MHWCSHRDILTDTEQTCRKYDFLSVLLCHLVLANVLARCDNARHVLWIGWNVSASIPWEAQPLSFLCCLLFSPALNTILITTHLLFHALKSVTLHQFAVAWDLAPGLQSCVTDSGKTDLIWVTLLPSLRSTFPAHLPVTDAPVQSLGHSSGALNTCTRLRSYQTSHGLDILLFFSAFS